MSFIYKIAKEKMIDGTLGSLKTGGVMRAALATSIPVETAVTLPNIIGTAQVLGTDQTSSGGVYGASALVFSGIPSGNMVYGVVIYKAGVPNIPIAFIDSGIGLPQVTDGNPIPVSFPTTGSKIFAL